MALTFIRLGLDEVDILVDSLDTSDWQLGPVMMDKSFCGKYFIACGSGDQQYINKVLRSISMLGTEVSYEKAVDNIEVLLTRIGTPTVETGLCVAGFSASLNKMVVTMFTCDTDNTIDKSTIVSPNDQVTMLSYPIIDDKNMMDMMNLHIKNMTPRNLKCEQACQYIGDTLNENMRECKIGGALVLNTLFVENRTIHSNKETFGYVTGVTRNLIGQIVCYSPNGIKVKGIDKDFETVASMVKPDMRIE